jgi:hypothetical protein
MTQYDTLRPSILPVRIIGAYTFNEIFLVVKLGETSLVNFVKKQHEQKCK